MGTSTTVVGRSGASTHQVHGDRAAEAARAFDPDSHHPVGANSPASRAKPRRCWRPPRLQKSSLLVDDRDRKGILVGVDSCDHQGHLVLV